MSKTTTMILRVWVNICRIVLAVTFIFSGFVKAIDPRGTQYKFEDYFSAFGWSSFIPDAAPLVFAIALSTLEFIVGISLFFGIRRRATSVVALLIMLFMTPLTLYLALANPVSDCGCFGDALVLTNWQTFAKNVVLLLAAVFVVWKPLFIRRFISERNQWIISLYTLLFILLFAMQSLYHLPMFDFRPYHIGANIPQSMKIPEGAEESEFETTFILEKNGEQKEFTLDDYPDSTWTFIDSKTKLLKQGYEPPIHDFSLVETETGEDITEQVLADSSYTFLLISPWLNKADDSHIDLINELYDYARSKKYGFYCLTSSTDSTLLHWSDATSAEYPYCNVDATTLKTIVRANPGLVLLKNGTVINKWGNNDFPNEYQLKDEPLEKLPFAQLTRQNPWNKVLRIMAMYAFPLLLVVFLDRIWVGSKYYRMLRRRKKLSTKK